MFKTHIGNVHIKARGNRVSLYMYGIGLRHYTAKITDTHTLALWLLTIPDVLTQTADPLIAEITSSDYVCDFLCTPGLGAK